NVDAGHVLDCPDNYDLPLRGKLINPRPIIFEGIELRGRQNFRQIAYQRQIVNTSTRASDSWCRGRKRNYAMSIKRLFDAVERRGDIGWRVAALVLPISNRPRVTSSCAGKIGLREPGEHTSGPNLASRDNVGHNQNLYTIVETPPPASRFVESRPGHVDVHPRSPMLKLWMNKAVIATSHQEGGSPPSTRRQQARPRSH